MSDGEYTTERALVGLALRGMGEADDVIDLLDPTDFESERLRPVWAVVKDLRAADKSTDAVAVSAALAAQPAPAVVSDKFTTLLDYLGGDTELYKLPDAVSRLYIGGELPAVAYAQAIKNQARKRAWANLGRLIQDKVSQAEHQGRTLEDFEPELERAVMEFIDAAPPKQEVRTFADVAASLYDRLAAYRAGTMLSAIPTPWVDLNRIFYGLESETLTTIAAASGAGKSTFMLQLADHAAKQGKRVLFLSLEMSGESLLQRLIAQELYISTSDQRRMSDDQWTKYTNWHRDLSRSIDFAESEAQTPGDIRRVCRAQKRAAGLDVVIVDYVQLLQNEERTRSDTWSRELQIITRNLKRLSRELKLAVVIGAQYTKDAQDRRPTNGDIRDSSSIITDSDKILHLWRKITYDANGNPIDDVASKNTKVIVGKHRNGPVGECDLVWVPEQVRFVSMALERHERNAPVAGFSAMVAR